MTFAFHSQVRAQEFLLEQWTEDPDLRYSLEYDPVTRWYYVYLEDLESGNNDCDGDLVLSIEEIQSNNNNNDDDDDDGGGWVYDIETDHGTFQAGIGDIVVKNTDSVFVKFNTHSIAEAFRLGNEAADKVSAALFQAPIKLEFEKVYCPLMMIGKKRYVGQLYNEKKGPDAPAYVDYKGVELKRRDNCVLVKEVYQGMIDIVLSQGRNGISAAKAFVQNTIESLMAGRIPMEKLVVTKTLKGDYKSPRIPHKMLVERMAERNPGSEPKINDRVPFVFIEHADPRAKQFEIIEDPEWVKTHPDLKLNAAYYLEHQLRTPIVQFLGTICPDITVFMDTLIAKEREKKLGPGGWKFFNRWKMEPGQTKLCFPRGMNVGGGGGHILNLTNGNGNRSVVVQKLQREQKALPSSISSSISSAKAKVGPGPPKQKTIVDFCRRQYEARRNNDE